MTRVLCVLAAIALWMAACEPIRAQPPDVYQIEVTVSATDSELMGPYLYFELRPDQGQPSMISGREDGELVTWLRVHRNERVRLRVETVR